MFKREDCKILFGILHDEMLNPDLFMDGIDSAAADFGFRENSLNHSSYEICKKNYKTQGVLNRRNNMKHGFSIAYDAISERMLQVMVFCFRTIYLNASVTTVVIKKKTCFFYKKMHRIIEPI